jgi:diguanylate cyclase (GGDEF)-like protein/hemerythrin-like metal-binding protein
MEGGGAVDLSSRPRVFDANSVSKLVTGSKTVPFAVVFDGTIVFANPAFSDLFRATSGVAGTPMVELLDFGSRAAWSHLLVEPAEMLMTFLGRAIRLDGSSFNIELLLARETLDAALALFVFAEDITWRQLPESHLKDLAFTDSLTGLPNRAFALDRLRDAVAIARARKSTLGVLMADLDGLKRANDTLGHRAGDILIQTMGRRFLNCVRDGDMVARLGGDEFCVLLPVLRDAQDAAMIAARIVDAAVQPIVIDGQTVSAGVSVGIALFPHQGLTSDAVLAAADGALYEAKRAGRNRFAWAPKANSSAPLTVPLIIWAPSHEVGVEIIDEQHRKLTELLNDLVESLQRGDDQLAIAESLAATIAYTRFHFETEEGLMEKYAYVAAAPHREAHAHLLDDLQNFPVATDVRSLSLTVRFLQEWLLRHIVTSDRALARALNARGVH